MTFQHILVPVDFSQRMPGVIQHARAMAETLGSKISLLHVVQRPIAAFPVGPYVLDWDPAETVTFTRALLDQLVGFGTVPVQRFVEVGDPATLIVDFANRNSVDLIMMPTHGHGKFRSLLLGSVTAKVLHDAGCSVWTNAHREDPKDLPPSEIKNVLCAAGLEAESVGLLERASQLAKACGARLVVVHAIPALSSGLFLRERGDFADFLRDTARKQLAESQAQAHTNAEIVIAEREISKAVRELAEDRGVDLVAIGRGSISKAFGRLRTHSYAIIRDSPCPVISF